MSKEMREQIDRVKNWKQFNENIYKPTFKDIDKPLYKEPKTGKEHSLNYEDIDSEFSKYLIVFSNSNLSLNFLITVSLLYVITDFEVSLINCLKFLTLSIIFLISSLIVLYFYLYINIQN